MDKVYVKFIRPSSEGEDKFELLTAGYISVCAIPKQGEWILLKLTHNQTIHSQVTKVTTEYYQEHRETFSAEFMIHHIEISIV